MTQATTLKNRHRQGFGLRPMIDTLQKRQEEDEEKKVGRVSAHVSDFSRLSTDKRNSLKPDCSDTTSPVTITPAVTSPSTLESPHWNISHRHRQDWHSVSHQGNHAQVYCLKHRIPMTSPYLPHHPHTCAMTLESAVSIMEWMMLCGWMTTSMSS